MAHYAFLDGNNLVTEVITGIDENELIEGLDTETWYGNFRGQTCKRTSYNNNIRKQYAGIGYTYDAVNDVFILPQPYPSWSLNENFDWQAPTPMPIEGRWYWDEDSLSWLEQSLQIMAKLCAAGIQLREQIDDDYPDRDRKSDGWIADARHLAKGSSDHIPIDGIVRALDIDADLSAHKEEAYALVEKIRKLAKKGDKRIKYIIYDGKIMSPILGWKRRAYKGANPHRSHFHISFTTLGDKDGSYFNLEGEANERLKENGRELGKDIPSNGASDLSSSRPRCKCNCQCSSRISLAQHHQLAKP